MAGLAAGHRQRVGPSNAALAAALDRPSERGGRGRRLTFTSPGADGYGLRSLPESCLLRGEKYAAEPDTWRRLSHAFDRLPDPVS
ncbi:hypothetical protein BLA24_16700 [Streptomyces cinnamoneus]|uniref:Uncharacterized protein n=1 Tax=Streptomyces cinnamoneus TaxID=53446 RepID=A0A2G1XGW7_STRCJ|nr:hypothetical protein BLA24_16700 [Streptomyces cinnamoneus]PPT14268.1 hypothetical protein CYQ11_16585 [Streptomyces cinnamoneus]